jgi:uncharacterized membrane protein YcgQ (UPF0703/DUF1980 family)
MKAVQIVWLDSASTDKWTRSDVEDLSPVTITSIGYIVKETDDYLAITHSIDTHEGRLIQFAGFITIPKAAIIKRKPIKL